MSSINERRISLGSNGLTENISSVTLHWKDSHSLMTLPFSDRSPAFINPSSIEQHAERIEREMAPHILRGAALFAERNGLGESTLATPDEERAWQWAVKASKYNAVYNVSRREAAQDIGFVRKHAGIIDSIGDFIDTHGGVTPIVNFALHSYVQSFAKEPGKKVLIEKKSVPPHAIQAYDKDTLVVRPYFLDTDPQSSFASTDEIHDWHDLSHILAASYSNGAFGVKYHEGLGELDRYYRALTEGKGMRDATGPLFSDGLLFTQLSLPLFEFYESQHLPDGSGRFDNDQIQRLITAELFSYLGGEHELFHPGIGMRVKTGRPIDPLELAICIQNKRYERRAAEVETTLFVRGTPDGSRGIPSKDPLFTLSRSHRIEQISDLGKEQLYFEGRNIIRHRAHEDALGQYANYLLLQMKKTDQLQAATYTDSVYLHDEAILLEEIVSFYQMEDLQSGEETNLYKIVGSIINARKEKVA